MKKKKTSFLSVVALVLVVVVSFAAGYIVRDPYLALARGLSHDQIRLLKDASKIINAYSLYGAEEEDMVNYALKGMAASLDDDYAYYFTPDELKEYNDSSSGVVEGGIGATVTLYGNKFIVSDLYKDFSADKAGIRVGDIIIGVDGVSTDGEDFAEMIDRVVGKPGTEVRINVLRDGKELAFDVTRTSGQRQMTEYSMIENTKILYTRIVSFHGNATDYFKEALKFGEANGYEKLIIDLRGNLGGELSTFEPIADILLPEGETFYAMNKKGQKLVSCTSDADCIGKPICVLMNENTASASEALAGALRDLAGASLVGTVSYGKGIMQTNVPLVNGGMFKLTTAEYYIPSGVCIQGQGLAPDYEITLPDELSEMPWLKTQENDTQLQKAISVLNG